MFSEGVYKAKALSWGWAETSNNNPQFWMKFEVIGVADPNNLEAAVKPCDSGTRTWTITPSTAKSEDWLISTVQHLGFDGDDVLGLDPDREGAFNFEGVEFFVACKHEEYQGQMREKWSVHSPKAKLTPDKFLALNQRMGARVKAMKDERV